MAIDSQLINVKGKFIDSSRQINVLTVQHAREIQHDRCEDSSLKEMSFYTADFALYRREKGEEILYIGDAPHNLILRNSIDAVSQLEKNHNYFPTVKEMDEVISADSTLRIVLSELELNAYTHKNRRYPAELAYVDIDISKLSKLIGESRKLAERIHGTHKEFTKNIELLANRQSGHTDMWVVSPLTVKKTLKEFSVSGFGRICVIDDCSSGSNFYACSYQVNSTKYYLRGSPLHRII